MQIVFRQLPSSWLNMPVPTSLTRTCPVGKQRSWDSKPVLLEAQAPRCQLQSTSQHSGALEKPPESYCSLTPTQRLRRGIPGSELTALSDKDTGSTQRQERQL